MHHPELQQVLLPVKSQGPFPSGATRYGSAQFRQDERRLHFSASTRQVVRNHKIGG